MTTTALTAPRVATGGRVLAPGWVQVDQGRVRDVGAGAPPPEALAPLGLIVPAHLIVEALARRRGLDPDAPRGLSKVTQTDPA